MMKLLTLEQDVNHMYDVIIVLFQYGLISELHGIKVYNILEIVNL
jgi:hypothetical protein